MIMRKIKKSTKSMRFRGVRGFLLMLLSKLPSAISSVYFAGNNTSRIDILRHRIDYSLCKSVNDKSLLPDDFPFFRTMGSSSVSDEILITPHSNNYENSYLIRIDGHGKILNYRKINGFGYAFRKYKMNTGKTVYAYLNVYERFSSEFDNAHLVILDEHLKNELGRYSMIRNDIITEDNYPVEQHEYIILGEDHFIVSCVKNRVVTSVPGYEGQKIKIVDSIIQEQKDGAVVYQFVLSDHPELFNAALLTNEYSDYVYDGNDDNYADFGHLNSIDIDPDTGDWLVSYRRIGLVKIDRNDGHIKWVMGRKRCDIRGISFYNICLLQHDARYQKDGSITVFDNDGSPRGKSRICRYWLDEATLTLKRFKEYVTKIPYSGYMGGAQLTDDENEVFEITYGSAYPYIAFEEYDFGSKRQKMKLIFEDGYDMYQVSAVKKDHV